MKYVSRLMHSLCVVLIASLVATGCGGYIVVDSTDKVTESQPRVLQDEIRYTTGGVAVVNDEMTITLARECNQVQEVDVSTVRHERREYRTTGLWWTSVGVALGLGTIGLSLYLMGDAEACDPDFEFDNSCAGQEGDGSGLQDAGLYTAVGGLAIAAVIAGVAAYYEFSDHDTTETLDTQTRRDEMQTACTRPWPTGRVTLMAGHANQSFDGDSLGDGRVTVDVSSASRDVWLDATPLQLALPDELDWVDIQVPDTVRSALLKGDNAGDAERVYVWFDVDEEYTNLLTAGTQRVQGVMTHSKRYQFLSDAKTRQRIQSVVDQGGGSAEARRQSALEAARAEDIKKVVQLTVTPLYKDQVQFSLSVFNTTTGDQIYTTQAAADLSNAVAALEVFDGLASSFLSWERQ